MASTLVSRPIVAPLTPGTSFRYTADINSPKNGGKNGSLLIDNTNSNDNITSNSKDEGFQVHHHENKEDNNYNTNNNTAAFTVRSVASNAENTNISPGPNGALRQTPPSTPPQRNIISNNTNNRNTTPVNTDPVTLPPTVTPAHHDHEIPAALAALLHQTDKSGKQQKATPHTVTTPSSTSISNSSTTGSVPFPSLSSHNNNNNNSSSVNSPTSRGNNSTAYPTSPDNTLHASSNTSSNNRGLFSAFCCFSPAAVPVDVNATTALVSNVETHTDNTTNQDTTNNRYTDNPSDTNGSSAPNATSPSISSSTTSNRPNLTLNLTSRTNNSSYSSSETPSRRRLVNGRSIGDDTPSKVLSPTSLTVRSTIELYGKQAVPPWGSQHPAVVHANIMAHSHGRQFGSRSKINNGYAFGNSGGTGYHYPSSLGYNSPIISNANPSTPGVPPSSKKKVKRTGPRPAPPTNRINNVRRPASSIGEGPLLAPLLDCDIGKPCLVLDLDETLVHSSFKPVPKCDYILPVEIEGITHHVYVIKRPGCEEFLERVGKMYEVVIFTASLSKYADPLLDLLDPTNVIRARLFREACVYHEGNYVKDLSLLGRDPRYTIIIDNSPASYLFQPENALACDTFIDDMNDTELYVLLEFLESVRRVKDVRTILRQWAIGNYNGVNNEELHSDSDGEGGGASMYHPHLDFYDPDNTTATIPNDDNDNNKRNFSSSQGGDSIEFSSDDDNTNKLNGKFDAVVRSPKR